MTQQQASGEGLPAPLPQRARHVRHRHHRGDHAHARWRADRPYGQLLQLGVAGPAADRCGAWPTICPAVRSSRAANTTRSMCSPRTRPDLSQRFASRLGEKFAGLEFDSGSAACRCSRVLRALPVPQHGAPRGGDPWSSSARWSISTAPKSARRCCTSAAPTATACLKAAARRRSGIRRMPAPRPRLPRGDHLDHERQRGVDREHQPLQPFLQRLGAPSVPPGTSPRGNRRRRARGSTHRPARSRSRRCDPRRGGLA